MAGLLSRMSAALRDFAVTKSITAYIEDYHPRTTRVMLEDILAGRTQVTPQMAFRYYQQSSAVATAVDMITEKITAITPVVKRKQDLIADHPVLAFLSKPNDFQLWPAFIGDVARYWLLTHKTGFFAAGTITREPAGLFPVYPSDIGVKDTGPDGWPERYQVGRSSQYFSRTRPNDAMGLRYTDGPLREFYPIIGFSSRGERGAADSPLEAVLLEIQQHVEGRIYNTSLLKRSGRLSLSFIFKEAMSKIQYDQRVKAINEQFAGSENAGRIGVYAGQDLEIQEHGLSAKDMEYPTLDAFAMAALYRRYQIPLPLVTESRQTFSNYAEAIWAFYDDAVIPTLTVLYGYLTAMLFPRFGLDPTKEQLTYDPFEITALRQRMLDELTTRRDLGLETINELRDNLPDRDNVEGGAVVMYPSSFTAIAGDDYEPPQPFDMTGDPLNPDDPLADPVEEPSAPDDTA